MSAGLSNPKWQWIANATDPGRIDGPDCSIYVDSDAPPGEDAKLAQHIAALLTGGGWQDIATAPKDGTRVLLNADHAGRRIIIVGRYGLQRHLWHAVPGKDPIQPTHWMPLPEPPRLNCRRAA